MALARQETDSQALVALGSGARAVRRFSGSSLNWGVGMSLKQAIVVLAIACGFAAPAFAVGRTDLDVANDPSSAVRRVVTQQLDAFRHDDAERAFALAAPAIRRAFRDAKTFMALVAKEYLPVTRWTAATFLDMRASGGHFVQRVRLVDGAGAVSVANYAVARDETGEWLVVGVAMEDQPGRSRPE